MDWLALFTANSRNPDVRRPADVSSFARINTGALYTVRSGDNVPLLAERFYTTVDSILSVNPEITSAEDTLSPGTELCVLPALCDVWCENSGNCVRTSEIQP